MPIGATYPNDVDRPLAVVRETATIEFIVFGNVDRID
jgi:hypothetical protein